MSHLKIGFDAKRAFFNQRGLGNYSRATISILSRQQPDNNYYLFTPGQQPKVDFERGDNCRDIYPQGSFYKMFPSWWRTYGITRAAQRLDIDIYHGLSHELPVGIEKTPIKTVVTMHDLIFLKHPEWFGLADRYLFRKKYVNSCLRANHVIAISESTKKDLVEMIGVDEDKISVVYQGCSPLYKQPVGEDEVERIRQKFNLPSEYMITICALEQRKNHSVVLQALAKMEEKIPYVIVGRPTEFEKEIRKQIAELKLEKWVFILHDAPTEDLPALYHGALLSLYPSFYEGFGIPILEAQNCGTPVITSQGSSLREAGGNGALYLNANRPDEWAFAIKSLLQEDILQAKLKRFADENVVKFSDEEIARHLQAVYDKL